MNEYSMNINRFVGSAEASDQYLFPAKTYDLTLDTFQTSIEECTKQIKKVMRNKPKAVNRVRYSTGGNIAWREVWTRV